MRAPCRRRPSLGVPGGRGQGDTARPTGQELLTPGGAEAAAGGQPSEPGLSSPTSARAPATSVAAWMEGPQVLLSSFRRSGDLPGPEHTVPCGPSRSAGCREGGRHTGRRVDLPLLGGQRQDAGRAAGVTLLREELLCRQLLEGLCVFGRAEACPRDSRGASAALSSERGRRCPKPPAPAVRLALWTRLSLPRGGCSRLASTGDTCG